MGESLKSSLGKNLQKVSEEYNIGESLFLIGSAIITLIAFEQTLGMEREASSQIPWILITIMSISLTLIIMNKFIGDQIRDFLGKDDMGIESDTASKEQVDGGIEGMYDLDLLGVSKELAIITAYILAIINIGFFITTVAFIFGYIMVKEASPLGRRAVIAVIWTGFIISILYVLFVHLLQVSSIFRLGILF
ncbi:hypothetical protein [Halalkalicoccus salilacus]|uniref:hypothetical protein n=1 Tax=Halalkalicoccus TaxID=332246 RepID=UPI002F967FD8